jgi:D-alanyl-lipoteichoic acid acyltransferase DltB (MBOAT superfamily)
MTPSPLSSLAITDAGFAVLAGCLVAAAWSTRLRPYFPLILGVISMILLATWLDLYEAMALVLFLIPPFLVARYLWGRPDRSTRALLVTVIAWEVLVFLVVRRYEWLDVAAWAGFTQVVAVIGLSYMLFRAIHLVIEAPYLGGLPMGPWDYFTYVCAFWTLLSGPIQRYEDFRKGLEGLRRPETRDALAACHRIVNGLIKAFVLAPVFLAGADVQALARPDAGWLDFTAVFYGYPFYLYLNFSGYTDAMIGLGRLCGFDTLPENFNWPYLSRNIQDFWGRWHISFGVWIRSYVFSPLCKQLLTWTRGRRPNLMTAIAVLVTFVLVGMWHGTTTSFLVFGILHGAAVVVVAVYGGLLKASLPKDRRKAFLAHPATRTAAVLVTFHFTCATMLLFASPLPTVLGSVGTFMGMR